MAQARVNGVLCVRYVGTCVGTPNCNDHCAMLF